MTTQSHATAKARTALLGIEELAREREQLSALAGAIRARLAPRDERSNPLDIHALLLCERLEDRLEDWGRLIAMREVLESAGAGPEHTGTADEEAP